VVIGNEKQATARATLIAASTIIENTVGREASRRTVARRAQTASTNGTRSSAPSLRSPFHTNDGQVPAAVKELDGEFQHRAGLALHECPRSGTRRTAWPSLPRPGRRRQMPSDWRKSRRSMWRPWRSSQNASPRRTPGVAINIDGRLSFPWSTDSGLLNREHFSRPDRSPTPDPNGLLSSFPEAPRESESRGQSTQYGHSTWGIVRALCFWLPCGRERQPSGANPFAAAG
jgi:hypothetical protein